MEFKLKKIAAALATVCVVSAPVVFSSAAYADDNYYGDDDFYHNGGNGGNNGNGGLHDADGDGDLDNGTGTDTDGDSHNGGNNGNGGLHDGDGDGDLDNGTGTDTDGDSHNGGNNGNGGLHDGDGDLDNGTGTDTDGDSHNGGNNGNGGLHDADGDGDLDNGTGADTDGDSHNGGNNGNGGNGNNGNGNLGIPALPVADQKLKIRLNSTGIEPRVRGKAVYKTHNGKEKFEAELKLLVPTQNLGLSVSNADLASVTATLSNGTPYAVCTLDLKKMRRGKASYEINAKSSKKGIREKWGFCDVDLMTPGIQSGIPAPSAGDTVEIDVDGTVVVTGQF